MINKPILQQKIHSLLQYSILNDKSVQQFGEILNTLDDWNLFRINPLRFAKQHGFDETESLNIFVHGVKIGLFDLSYHMLCPLCHGIVHNHHSLEELENDLFHCVICDLDVATTLDDLVEVSFTIHPSIKSLDINPFSNLENYHDYYFSNNYRKSEQATAFCQEQIIKGLLVLAPDERKTFPFNITSNQVYQLVNVEYNMAVVLNFHERNGKQELVREIDLLPTVLTVSEVHLPLNSSIHIRNRINETVGCLIMKIDGREKLRQMIQDFPSTFTPFLTAKMLLNNQSFRDLFRISQSSANFNVNVKNLTIMFTDLRGSTEMYDKAGDVFAYKLVQEHFKILADTVRQFSGAIVKTMGDAIMATFSRPLDGFLASLDMLNKIEQMNQSWRETGYKIGLKVGINEGPALAVVNDERIDYFGQSVNIAARVQGLAQAGEVWIAQSILESPGVMEKLAEHGYQTEQHSANLKGVEQPTIVHKVFKAYS